MASYVEDDTDRILSNMDDAALHQEYSSSSNSLDLDNQLDYSLGQSFFMNCPFNTCHFNICKLNN